MHYVYILYSEKTKKYYKGQTANLQARIQRHNMSIEKSTRGGAPWKLVAYFTKADRSEAMILERKLKNLDKDRLEDFIRKYFKVAVTDDLP